MPEEWAVSAYCEAFGYKPTEALRELYGLEWDEAPYGLHETILMLRAYANAKAVVASGDRKAIQRCPMAGKVYEITMEIANENRERGAE